MISWPRWILDGPGSSAVQWLFASELFSTARLKRMEDEDLALYEAVVGLDKMGLSRDKMGLSSKSKGCVSIYSIIYIYTVF